MARPPLTDDQLQRAFRVYRRPSWPTSFEAAMADPIVSRLVRLRATGDAIDAERAGRARPLSPFQRWRARSRPRAVASRSPGRQVQGRR